MIPDFNEFGHLPVGGHACSWPEFNERFRGTDKRRDLCEKLEKILNVARGCGFLKVLIGGSFPTAVEEPNDIDLTWITDFNVTKDTVKPECIELMDDMIAKETFGWNMLYLPIDHDLTSIQSWAAQLGFCRRTLRDRGMLVIDL